MITLYAQPYKTEIEGFFFKTIEEYKIKKANLRSSREKWVNEVQIRFVKGEVIDNEVFKALKIHQYNFEMYLKVIAQSSFEDKIKMIIGAEEIGSSFQWQELSECDVEVYEFDSFEDFSIHCVDEGLYGEIPKNLECYIDYSKIARDLAFDYSKITILEKNYIYRFY